MVKRLQLTSMRALRWLLVMALLLGMSATPGPLHLRVQQVRAAMTRHGVRLIYADFGS